MQGDGHYNLSKTGYSDNDRSGYDVVTTYFVEKQQNGTLLVSVAVDNQQQSGGLTNLLLTKGQQQEEIPYQPADYAGDLVVGGKVTEFTVVQGEKKSLGSFIVNASSAFTSVEYANQHEQDTLNYIQSRISQGWTLIETKSRTAVQLNPVIGVN